MQPGIVAEGVRKSYRAVARRTRVLEGVDLEIAPGEIVGLIGPNGAGKTTLVSCLMAFIRPDAGRIEFDGRPADHLSIRRRTGYVPERLGFEKRMSGRQFIRYHGRLSGIRGEELTRRTDDLLERFAMTAAADRPMGSYSRGMLQRVALAQAILHAPDFLLLDEPTSGVDPLGVILVRQILDEERRRGAAILLNSHQLSEVEKICDRVAFLDGGTVAGRATLTDAGPPDLELRFLDRPGAADRLRALGWSVDGALARRTAESDEAINDLLRAAIDEGVAVTELRRRTPGLEHFFDPEAR
ncbi:MAG: ABC transporter ATP-binding protein [Acidobacteria bacterium]|nr:ABC transporter ATP-binding protein [Acidobacteriota bacterium]